jgi:cellulose synthase/poly-beta-1,6-N-acetylglucosamine synthase-like glycosyltransferase
MKIFVAIVFAYFLLFAAFHVWLLIMAAIELRRHASEVVVANLRRTIRSPLSPPISIIVPAYNEEVGIIETVNSMLALEYPNFEVVVVNDGSSDATVERMVEAFDMRKVERPTPPHLPHAEVRGVYVPRGKLNLLLVDKENGGGKADAMNAGINFANFPLVCAIDADSVLEQDALVKTAMPFIEDPERTIATGGLVRIANGCRVEGGRVLEAGLPRALLPMFQVVEYLRAFFGSRTGWSAVGGLLIISGAFGLFRKDALIAAGGYNTDAIGEDMELVVRLHRTMREKRRPYRIVYVPDPVCWTEGPESTKYLRRQRVRWMRGSLEVLLMHRRMLFNPRYRAVGLLSLPALLLFEVVGPIVEVGGYVVATILFATGGINLETFLLFLLVAVLYGLILSFGSIAIEDATFGRHPGWDQLGKVMLFAVMENIGYRQLTLLWRLEGFPKMFQAGEWEPMERKGLAEAQSEEVVQDQVGLR